MVALITRRYSVAPRQSTRDSRVWKSDRAALQAPAKTTSRANCSSGFAMCRSEPEESSVPATAAGSAAASTMAESVKLSRRRNSRVRAGPECEAATRGGRTGWVCGTRAGPTSGAARVPATTAEATSKSVISVLMLGRSRPKGETAGERLYDREVVVGGGSNVPRLGGRTDGSPEATRRPTPSLGGTLAFAENRCIRKIGARFAHQLRVLQRKITGSEIWLKIKSDPAGTCLGHVAALPSVAPYAWPR